MECLVYEIISLELFAKFREFRRENEQILIKLLVKNSMPPITMLE